MDFQAWMQRGWKKGKMGILKADLGRIYRKQVGEEIVSSSNGKSVVIKNPDLRTIELCGQKVDAIDPLYLAKNSVTKNDPDVHHIYDELVYDIDVHPEDLIRAEGENDKLVIRMTILNETAAEIAGSEIGKLAYNRLEINQDLNPLKDSLKSKFDFNDEMRTTREKLDILLKKNQINKAESYLENRTLAFQESGFNIRKLNQAYFAFYGTYGQNPASSTTIADDLQLLRGKSKNLEEFIKTVSEFGNYNDFLSYIISIR